jgi:iron complex outermembrane receptor protein
MSCHSTRIGLSTVAAAIIATWALHPARAEESTAAASSDSLSEIIVTAERRQVQLQRAALALTALPAAALEQSNIHQLSDLNGFVPGLTIEKDKGYLRVVTIRGIGFESAENQSAEPGVAFHVDGVYIARPVSLAMDLFDIDHIEVLRGPQGTVFGKSATGGLVNVIRAKPILNEFSGSGELSLGNYSLVQANGVLNLPLSDTVAVRFAGQEYRHDGFAHETGLADYKLDDADNLSGKAAILWKPADNFTATLTTQYFDSNTHGAALKNIYDPDPNPRDVSQDFPNTNRIRVNLTNADLEWDLDGAALRSTTAYQRLDMDATVDVDRLEYAITGNYLHAPLFQYYGPAITQELNLSSTSKGSLDWIVGAFYMYDSSQQHYAEYAGTDSNPTYTIVSGPPLPYNLSYAVDTDLRRTTLAEYAQGTFHVGERLRLTAGLRYSHDKLANTTQVYYGLFGPASVLHPSSDKLTWKAVADFDVAANTMTYASVSTGYKPGGANLNNSPLLAPLTFKPENVTAYELGVKAKALDSRLRFNAAGFFYNYSNLQYQQEDPIPFQGGVANIPKVHTWGIETETEFHDASGLDLGGNLTWLGGKLESHYLALDPSLAHQATLAAAALGHGPFDPYTIGLRAAAVADTYGNEPPKMPGWQGSVHIAYTWAAAAIGTITPRLEYVYRGKFIYRIFNDGALDRVPGYGVVNLNVDYVPSNSAWTFSVKSTNVGNVAGIGSRYSDAFGLFTTTNQYIPPRQVIGSVKYEF